MKNKEMKEANKKHSHNARAIWAKSITSLLVVGCCIFFDLSSPNDARYSSSSSINRAMEQTTECKRAFPEQNVNVVLYKRYPGCYRNPQA